MLTNDITLEKNNTVEKIFVNITLICNIQINVSFKLLQIQPFFTKYCVKSFAHRPRIRSVPMFHIFNILLLKIVTFTRLNSISLIYSFYLTSLYNLQILKAIFLIMYKKFFTNYAKCIITFYLFIIGIVLELKVSVRALDIFL